MPKSETSPSHLVGLNILLAATALLSAWLLFQVQPMVAKRILPWFGGGAGIWTTAMLFFQAALFVGYLYAHLVAKALPGRKQVVLHAVLLGAAAILTIVIGVLPPDAWKPASSDRPAVRILAVLGASVGLPYLMLAATAPLMQVWFSRANPGRSPYRLYAISNAGSLAALLSYPLVLEPSLGLSRQGFVWSAMFCVFALICAAAGFLSLRATTPGSSSQAGQVFAHLSTDRPRYFAWIALPACASVLLLGVTVYMTQHVAPIPLLWVLPMVVYLLSFILTFDSDRWYARRFWMPVAIVFSFIAVFTWQQDITPPVPKMVFVHLVFLFAVCMVCHGELARLRPAPDRLTAFYLCIAGGGALGGLFTGIVAPLILPDQFELHIGIVFAWLLALFLLVTDKQSPFYDGGRGRAFAGLLAVVALFIANCIALGVHIRDQDKNSVDGTRNFYGTLKYALKDEPPGYAELTNGHIVHGAQLQDGVNTRIPTWYYHAESGIGKVLLELHSKPPRKVGLVGLGTGACAAYANSGDEFQFYDINPQVIDFADKHFTFLKEARDRGAKIEINQGDARLSLERQEPQEFDVIVLDAFNGDAIPTHLLTMEAFKLYLRHLDNDGILAVHVTNAYLKLDSVVVAAAELYGLDPARYDTPSGIAPGAFGSASWVLLHRQKDYFYNHKIGGPIDQGLMPIPRVPWTDDYTNVFSIVKW